MAQQRPAGKRQRVDHAASASAAATVAAAVVRDGVSRLHVRVLAAECAEPQLLRPSGALRLRLHRLLHHWRPAAFAAALSSALSAADAAALAAAALAAASLAAALA